MITSSLAIAFNIALLIPSGVAANSVYEAGSEGDTFSIVAIKEIDRNSGSISNKQ